MASSKNWKRLQEKERITNLASNDGYDREIIGYWRNTETGDVVKAIKIVEPGSANTYQVHGPKGKTIASGSAAGGGLTEMPKLTQKQAMNEAVEWMREHPMEQDSGGSSTSYDRQY